MKIRIAIQEKENQRYKHLHNITIKVKDEDHLKTIIKGIRHYLALEISEANRETLNWLKSRRPNMFERLAKEIDEDLIDWHSKGKDISRSEHLEIEMTSELEE